MSNQQPDPALESIAALQTKINELYGEDNLPPPCQDLYGSCEEGLFEDGNADWGGLFPTPEKIDGEWYIHGRLFLYCVEGLQAYSSAVAYLIAAEELLRNPTLVIFNKQSNHPGDIAETADEIQMIIASMTTEQ